MRLQMTWLTGATVVLLALAGCAAEDATGAGPAHDGVPGASSAVPPALAQRVDALQAAVTAWAGARDLAAARAAAETARNLVTGPGVTGYGDRDGDGLVGGRSDIGLLPGEHGEPGLASGLASGCLDRDVLGGSWDDPARRWADVRDRIARWSRSDNTFPGLASHPQRVVGWAQLTLDGRSLDEAHEFAGHAQLHVSVIRDALASC